MRIKERSEKLKEIFLEWKLPELASLFAAIFIIFLLIEGIIYTSFIIENNPDLIKKETIINFLYSFAVPFAVLTLFFQFSGVVENKYLKKHLLEFSGNWFAVFIIFIILTLSRETGAIYYHDESNQDMVRLFGYIFHFIARLFVALYIAFIATLSVRPLVQILFFSSTRAELPLDFGALANKYNSVLVISVILLAVISVYIVSSVDGWSIVFYK